MPVCVQQAILFLVEVDNALYAFGLGELWRRRMETAGRVELQNAEVAALGISKWIHFFCVFFAVLFGVVILRTADGTAGRFANNCGCMFLKGLVTTALREHTSTDASLYKTGSGHGTSRWQFVMPGLLPFMSFFIAGAIELAMAGMATGHGGFVQVTVPERPKVLSVLFCKMVGGIVVIAPFMGFAFLMRG